MPYAHLNGIRLYYEEEGSGPPLLLLEGLGYALWMWFRQRPALRQHFRLVLPDTRGVGLSEAPPGPYTIDLFASDAVALLDHLEIPRAHVLGVSMGGMVAMALALHYPERVERLVLVNTTAGGPEAVPMPPETLQALLAARALPPRDGLRAAMALAFATGYMAAHPEEVEQILDWRLARPQSPEAWAWQFQAGQAFDLSAHLREIRHPTLVVAGSADRVLPVANAALLADRLPHARLRVFEGGGHLVFIEQAEAFNRLVVDFLRGAPVEASPAGEEG
ncbi:MAG: alpha/beta fold hydrolase [Armatimonadota bacterium]|nr:alpha/beta fold hydrolase [Armatimonadota bacterium]MDR7447755.1 alpha/beta fold hydrolase [Armatimonadota bacterium]MDR7458532.1 alpha/beta fold hydrolase [Armatimonadota bacterium]MDR7479911.1 alpha/beta fold hydrolase [Armatimonadota bacterium]MDR7487741.1 alpha/beta fold hydrolase [Armatimonadota bacterium]